MELLGLPLLLPLLLVVPVHGKLQPANRAELKTGVDAWMKDTAKARVDYGGEIGYWDVSIAAGVY